MRQFNTNLAFVDLLFNLLVGFTSLFVISFMLINPIAKSGVVEPPVLLLAEATWPPESESDIDMYMRGPNGVTVYFANRDASYMVLERDDLGHSNDTYMVNGEEFVIKRNYEMISITALPPGEYVLNVHNFSNDGETIPVEVSLKRLSPFSNLYNNTVYVDPKKETTVISFVVDSNGEISDLRTDIAIPLRTGRHGP